MDEKWIPAMPIHNGRIGLLGAKELSGFKDWLEKFSGWLCLVV